MWSQWVCEIRIASRIGSEPNSRCNDWPRSRIPEPASRTMISPSARTSTQLVLPPYRTVPGPGVGIEPRTPQKITLVLEACTLLIEDRINCDTQTMSDQEFLHGAIHGSLLAVISKPHRGYWALLAAAWIWAIWSCAEYWREIDIALSRKDFSSDPVVVESFPCSPNPGPTQLSRCANALEPSPCAGWQ